jgi:hypothetical protein
MIVAFSANKGFNAPRKPSRQKVEDFLTGFTSSLFSLVSETALRIRRWSTPR